jgi:hypothetical protein
MYHSILSQIEEVSMGDGSQKTSAYPMIAFDRRVKAVIPAHRLDFASYIEPKAGSYHAVVFFRIQAPQWLGPYL